MPLLICFLELRFQLLCSLFPPLYFLVDLRQIVRMIFNLRNRLSNFDNTYDEYAYHYVCFLILSKGGTDQTRLCTYVGELTAALSFSISRVLCWSSTDNCLLSFTSCSFCFFRSSHSRCALSSPASVWVRLSLISSDTDNYISSSNLLTPSTTLRYMERTVF